MAVNPEAFKLFTSFLPNVKGDRNNFSYNAGFDGNNDVTVTINDFIKVPYCHITKQGKKNKKQYVSLTETELADLLSASDILLKKMKECRKVIEEKYGEVGDLDEDARKPDVLQKSEHTRKMEKMKRKRREENLLKKRQELDLEAQFEGEKEILSSKRRKIQQQSSCVESESGTT